MTLEKIIDYTVEQWGSLQAMQYIDSLEQVAQTLADNPDLGLKREALSADLFSFPCQRHVLYYKKILMVLALLECCIPAWTPVNI